jgi:hypothetical protein
MKLRGIYGLKDSEPPLLFAVRYLTANGEQGLMLSPPVRPEVSKGEGLHFKGYRVSFTIKLAAPAASS